VDCREARKLIERSIFGPLPADREAQLHAHRIACDRCRAVLEAESELTSILALLRVEPPFRVEVTARVLREAASIPPRERGEVPARQVGWAPAAATLAAPVLLARCMQSAPQLSEWIGAVRGTVSGAHWVGSRLLGSGLVVLETLIVLARSAWNVFEVGARVVSKMEPLARAAATVAILAMVITTVILVARDARRSVRHVQREGVRR
jgi:predicted anti-sigma-YlaC factor YlaD